LSSERRRTKYDIYADTIEVIAKKGLCSLTRVSYGANMPVDRAKKTLKFLGSHGFVREITVGDRKKYRATKWGLEYLETFKRMQRFFAALEEPVTIKIPQVVLPGRITTGYKDLDNMLFGGIPGNYAVILTSPSCDEKDLLIKRFLEAGAKGGQITFYVTTEVGGVRPLAEEFQTNFYLFPRRACIEIVSDVLLQHHAVHTRRWLTGLIPELKSRGFTTLAVMNPHMHPSEEVHAILGLFEGEMNIYEKETETGLEKFLKIRKMYNQRYLQSKMPLRKERLKA